jgi:hypothetical protein
MRPHLRQLRRSVGLLTWTSRRETCQQFEQAGKQLLAAWRGRRNLTTVALRRFNASTPPPASARLTHCETAPSVTPGAMAISFCFRPLALSRSRDACATLSGRAPLAQNCPSCSWRHSTQTLLNHERISNQSGGRSSHQMATTPIRNGSSLLPHLFLHRRGHRRTVPYSG